MYFKNMGFLLFAIHYSMYFYMSSVVRAPNTHMVDRWVGPFFVLYITIRQGQEHEDQAGS